jgi:hypothetical protein
MMSCDFGDAMMAVLSLASRHTKTPSRSGTLGALDLQKHSINS